MEIKIKDVTFTAADHLNQAATTQTYTITLPPGSYQLAFMGRVKTAFAGVTLPQVKAGSATDLDLYMPLQDISIAGDLISGGPGAESPGFCPKIRGRFDKTETNKTMTITFTSQSGNFSSLTAGEIEFVVVYIE